MFKKWLGRILSVTLVVCLLMAVVPFTVFAADPTFSSGTGIYPYNADGSLDTTLTSSKRPAIKYVTKKPSDDDYMIKLTPTWIKDGTKNIGCTLTVESDDFTPGVFESYRTLLQVLNRNSGYALSFDYTVQIGAKGGSITIGETSVTESGTYIIDENTSSIPIEVKSGAQNGADTTLTLTNFKYFDPEAAVQVTVNAAAGGKVITTNGEVGYGAGCEESTTLNVVPANGTLFKPDPDEGYAFFGYVDQNNTKMTMVTEGQYDKYYPTGAVSLTPIFARPGIDPVFMVGSKLFTDLNTAAAQGGTVIPVQDCTIPEGVYVIPNGTTLLIPDDASNTVYTNYPLAINSYTKPTVYRRLTLGSGAQLNFAPGSAMSVGGQLFAANGGKSCSVTKSYGQLIIENGAEVNFQENSNLYAWGFVTDKAGEDATTQNKVHIESGATVYEMFQICDFPGGTITSNLMLASTTYFPLSQYYVQNVECRMRIDAGATEQIYGALYAASTVNNALMVFIGPEDGSLFKLTDGYIVKYYDRFDDRVECDILGDATISPVEVTIAGQTINTTQRQMPINNIGVNVMSGTLATDQAIVLLPDSYISVDEGATFDIRSDVYLVDAADWIGGSHVYPTGSNLRPLVYSATLADNGVPNGKSQREQKGGTGSMESAVLDVNGTVNIEANGTLVTTGSGAQIISSEGTAQIINNSEKNVTPLALGSFTGNTNTTTVTTDAEIQTNVLRNDDGTTIRGGSDDVYTYDAETGTWITKGFIYFDDKTDATLSLDGNICAVMRFMIPSDTNISDYTVTINGKNCDITPMGSDYYKVIYPVKIAELTDTLEMKIICSGAAKAVYEVIPASYGLKAVSPNGELVDEDNSYYLAGSFHGSSSWDIGTIQSKYHFVKNLAATDYNEYMLTNVCLAKGDEIKVTKFRNNALVDWYPTNENNYYINETGIYDIYLRPDGANSSDWYGNCIFVQKIETTAENRHVILEPLVEATLNLSNQAQIFWNHNTNNPAYSATYTPQTPAFGAVDSGAILSKLGRQQALSIDENVFASYGLKYTGSTLVLNDNTKIKHYFIITNQTLYDQYKNSFTFDGEAVSAKTHDGTEIFFEVAGIAAVDLDKQYVLTNSQGEASISYAALDYAVKVINRNYDNEAQLRTLMFALYWYNLYADAYWA
ncbi:MAG: hypothetical protein IJJ15_09595 [Ruminococcus sp.]|nr:hypothetical protein [Ruminococcus sp.]